MAIVPGPCQQVRTTNAVRRDKGQWSGWAGALCLSFPGRQEDAQDKHKAPASAPHHTLSLQEIGRENSYPYKYFYRRLNDGYRCHPTSAGDVTRYGQDTTVAQEGG